MNEKSQVIRITLSEFLYRVSVLKSLDILGLLFISFLFYYFIPIIFINLTFNYSNYLIFFSLLAIFIQWYSNSTKVFFVIPSFHYFIILLVSSYYL